MSSRFSMPLFFLARAPLGKDPISMDSENKVHKTISIRSSSKNKSVEPDLMIP
jgi:hypothetical protein